MPGSTRNVAAVLWTLAWTLGACASGEGGPPADPVARAHDRYLYPADLEQLVTTDLGAEDSAALVRDYIDRWIKQQLLLEVAERNLPDQLADIDRQAREYRESLLIDAYLQNWVEQNLDTAVRIDEVQAFYDEHRDQYVLAHDVYRLDYIVVEQGVVNYDSLTDWFANTGRYREQIDRFCALYCVDYFLDAELWYGPRELRRNFPGAEFDPSSLEGDGVIEVRSRDRIFLLRVRERRRSGEPGPLAYWRRDIEKRILNRRRRELVKETYRDLYLEGGRREQFEIYTP